MIAMLQIVGPIFGLVATGFISRRTGAFEGAAAVLNKFVATLALPALLFQATAKIHWSELAHPGFLLAFGGGIAATFLASLALRRRDRLADASVDGLNATFANVGFMGIPLCLATLGEASLPPAVIATVLTACVLFGFALALVEIDLQAEPSWRVTMAKVGRTLVRNPLLIAPTLGLLVALAGIPVPDAAERFVRLLGGAASPTALVALGMFIGERTAPFNPREVARLVVLKLVVQPAVTWVLAFHAFAVPSIWAQTAVLMSAMPTGIGPFILVKTYGRDGSSTAGAILVSTLLSIITVSALVAGYATPTP